jgi:hypothetical protein
LSNPVTSTAGVPPCGPTLKAVLVKRWANWPERAGHTSSRGIAHACGAPLLNRLDADLTLADQALRPRRGPGLPLGHQILSGRRRVHWRHRGGRSTLRLSGPNTAGKFAEPDRALRRLSQHGFSEKAPWARLLRSAGPAATLAPA